MRGPSGLGASRAKEKGASRLARAGVLDRTLSTASKRNEIMAVISCASTVGWWEMQAIATPSRGQRFFTNHESRLFSPWCATGGATGNRRPDHCPRRQAAVFLFAIVHHCSLLFTIVRHCSAKKLFCAIVLAPPGRCFPARCGAAWGGYGAAWAAAVPRAGNTACGVFTSHETRNMGFPYSSGDSKENSPKPGQQVFHESRDTSHESRPLCFCRCFPARCGAAWCGYGAAWAAAVPRAGNTACKVFPNHETRDTAFMLFTRQESRNMVFPVPPAVPGRATPSPANGFFTNHESRDTNHGLYAFVAAFLRVMARHGAAMERHGQPPSPAPATRPVGFSPAMRHATWVFPIPPATPRRTAPSPVNRFFTNHESRDTNHGLYAFLPTISHDFPAFPAIIRPPSPQSRCPRAVRRRSRRLRAASAAVDAKGRTAPDSTAKTPLICVGSCPFVVNEPMLRKGRVRYCFDPKNDSLHVSPRGEAKWVRGSSGRGASRAEEKGARNMAFEGLSRITRHETRITAFYRVLRPSGGEKCRLMSF